MVGENTSLVAGLLAAGVILVLDLLLHAAAERWAPLGDALDGEPTILVDHGRILFENLRREGISDRELAVALRQNQLMTADEALYVYLETNGQISVIPRRDDGSDDADQSADVNGDSTDPATSADPARPGGAAQRIVRRFFHRRRRRPGRLSGPS